MKITRTYFYYFSICALSAVLLSGCGGSNNSTNLTPTSPAAPTTQSITGVVSDPEISGAVVTLMDAQGQSVGTATSGANGSFTIAGAPLGDLKNYKLVATGGVDTGTGEDLTGVDLEAPLSLFGEDYSAVVVTPLTSLVNATSTAEAVADQLGVDTASIAANPTSAANLAKASMKVILLRKEGQSFSDIGSALNGHDQLDTSDFGASLSAAATSRLTSYFDLIDSSGNSSSAAAKAYQEAIIRRTVRLSLSEGLAGLETADEATINNNLHALSTLLIGQLGQANGPSYLTPDDVVATFFSGNGQVVTGRGDSGFLSADELNDPAFNTTGFTVRLVDTGATFSDSLKLAFYNVENPLTGNDQLVVYDSTTGDQKVVKTDIILGDKAFVFDGTLEGDKTVFNSRKYGIILDPSQSRETRTAPDGRGGTFEYNFYFNNSFKRYDITNPEEETVIFDTSKIPQNLKDQGMAVLNSEYTLFNNVSDADNSYVELVAFEELADVLQGATPSSKFHTPVVVRLVDSVAVQGHMVKILKDANGKTEGVLTFFEAVHKKGSYPADAGNRKRLQLCSADLSSCEDIAGGDGKFYLQGSNDDYVYMAKEGTDTLYAYKQSDKSLIAVTGAKYPAKFNHKIHIVEAAHGAGDGLSRGFSNLSGTNSSLSDGQNAYVRINYDGDSKDPLASYRFLGDIHVFKHFQVLKLTGTTGVKMFDNGDGVDQADDSDTENVVGHGNLVAVNNGHLFIEIGNYEGAADNGGTCIPNRFGYGCSSIEYGYLNTSSINKTTLDKVLHPKKLLRYFVSRRIAPFALDNKLYISIFKGAPDDTVEPYVFTLNIHDLANPDVAGSTVDGRTYFSKIAQRDSGVFEGSVITWDGATGQLKNLSTNTVLGLANGTGGVIPDDPAILSVSSETSGFPIAGIGNLFAIKADPGEHDWFLEAGDVNEANGLEYVDRVPFAQWLYE